MSGDRDRVESALADAFRESGEMVTRWALIAEVIGPEGDRGVWTMGAEDLQAWETIGMLAYALERERARVAAAEFDDEDGDL